MTEFESTTVELAKPPAVKQRSPAWFAWRRFTAN